VNLGPSASTNVTAYYNVGAAGTGTLKLDASGDATDFGYYNVPVHTYSVAVTPDGGTTPDREANTNGYTATFTVQNTGTSTVSFGISCGGANGVTCTGTSTSSVNNLGASASTTVDAYYNVGAAGTGTLTLTATSTSGPSRNDGGSFNVPIQSYSVAVTPDGGTTPDRVTNSTGHSASFTVQNTGTSTVTYSISCGAGSGVTCTGVSQSSVQLGGSASTAVSAYYDVGAIGNGSLTLTATSTTGPARSDGGSFTVPIVPYPITNWDTKPFNHDNQSRGRCAVGCFAVTAAHTTVPYFSLDTPRNLTLVYSGDQVHPKPFVHLDVQKPTSQTPTYVLLQVKKQGVLQTFVNGETTLKFTAASSGYQRIGGQLRDSTWVTGMHDVEIIVTWDYGSSTTWQSWATRLMVVNETDASIARGWTIAGVQRVYPQAGSHALITEGDGSGVFFAYAGGNFTSPTGDFSKLEIYGAGWRRRYADSTNVVFNSAGLMTDVYDSFGARTQFFYDGSNRLTTVRDPNSKDLVLAYGSSPSRLNSIRDNVGTWRYTNVTVNTGTRQLTAIQDPDGVSTSFGYDGNHRLTGVTNRKGITTTFGWQTVNGTVTGKLRTVTDPTVQVYENGSLSNVAPVTTFAPWDTVGVPYAATASSPAAMVRPDTVSSLKDAPSFL
jgi:YD repeat-containing protein